MAIQKVGSYVTDWNVALFVLAPGETTFDIGIKMQEDLDYDPTMTDRSKGVAPIWTPAEDNEDKMVNVPIRTANFGAISVSIGLKDQNHDLCSGLCRCRCLSRKIHAKRVQSRSWRTCRGSSTKENLAR